MKRMTMMDSVALDTNILIYAHENDEPLKQERAVDLIQKRPHISSQTVSEYINVLRRKLPVPKDEVLTIAAMVIAQTELRTVSVATLNLAKALLAKYHLQIFDAMIVASALESNCSILYSEDMQHGLVVESKLRILNPFF